MEATKVAPYPLPPNEEERLTALYALDILDTAAEPSFDKIVRMAARLMDAPIALVSLVDRNRQWFKAKCGLAASETSRDFSFCTHAMLNHEPMVVCDATQDNRFSANPLVTGEMSIRFYVGAPLQTRQGLPLGSLCVIDKVVRPRPTPEQLESLADLALLVSQQIELHIAQRDLRAQESLLKEAQRIAHVGHWEWDVRTSSGTWSDETYRLYGLIPQSVSTLEQFHRLLAPGDRERVLKAVAHCLETGEPYALTHRIARANGAVIHVETRGRVELDGSGNTIRMLGTLLDVTARVQADELLKKSNEALEQRVAEEHRRTLAILAGQSNVLRKIAVGVPVQEIFRMLLDLCGKQAGGVMLLTTNNGQSHRWTADSHLPDEILAACTGIEILPGETASSPTDYELRLRESCAALASVALLRAQTT
jgi:PAS domain S-box-containing protein